jgi:hypothetical protein
LNEGDTIVTEITDDVREGQPVKAKAAGGPGQTTNTPSPPNPNAPPGGPSQYGNQAITDQNMQGQQGKQQQKSSGKQKKDSSGSESKQ